MTYCSVVAVLVLIDLTKKRFGHYAILKFYPLDHQGLIIVRQNLEKPLKYIHTMFFAGFLIF